MVAPCACWCPSSTFIRARSGSMAWISWRVTAPVSGSSAAITITLTRGKKSGTGKGHIELPAEKICCSHAGSSRFFQRVVQLFLFFQSTLAVSLPVVSEQYTFALVDGLQVDG